MIRLQAQTTFSRPYGTPAQEGDPSPAMNRWATLDRPYGTDFSDGHVEGV